MSNPWPVPQENAPKTLGPRSALPNALGRVDAQGLFGVTGFRHKSVGHRSVLNISTARGQIFFSGSRKIQG